MVWIRIENILQIWAMGSDFAIYKSVALPIYVVPFYGT